MKKTALWFSGALGFLIPALFALQIYTNNLSQNLATWCMVLVLDALGLILAFKGGNKTPYMQAGWTIAAVLIVAAILLNDATWHWGWIETVSVVCCLVAVALWQIKGAEYGLWPYVATLFISFAPQAIDYWTAPQPETWYLWTGSAVGCVLAMYGAPKRDLANLLVPVGAGILNIGVLAIVLR